MSLPSHNRQPRALARSLQAGAAFDLAFALPLVIAPEATLAYLAAPPMLTTYARLLAVLLGIVAGSYLVAAGDPRRERGLVTGAIAGRAVGAAVLIGGYWTSDPAPLVFLLVGLADAAFATAHWALRQQPSA